MFERVKYLSLLLLTATGVAMLVVGAIAEFAGFATWAGYLGMFAAVAFLLSASGYGFLYSIKAIATFARRWRSNA